MSASIDIGKLEAEIRGCLRSLPKALIEQAKAKSEQKGVLRRMRPFFQAVTELANNVPTLPASQSREELAAAFLDLAKHVEGIWDDSVLLYKKRRYSSSLFMSIVGIEELGKVAVARIHYFVGLPKRAPDTKLARKLRHHVTKHLLAASAGAVINSRMDRVIGIPTLLNFLEMAESGMLEDVRQRSLYYEVEGSSAHIPRKAVTPFEAAKYLVIFGELLAEVATAEPEPFEVLLKKVQKVESSIGWGKMAREAHAL